MLKEICPRFHARISALPLLGPHVEEFVVWLHAQGYPHLPIQRRVGQLPRMDKLLRKRGVRRIEDVTASDLLRLAPKSVRKGRSLRAVVRSLARFFVARGCLAQLRPSPKEELAAEYRSYLGRVRGLAESTLDYHRATSVELLSFIGFDANPARLHEVGAREIEAFLREMGLRLCRASLQHTVGCLRSFLRFLASRRLVAAGLDATIDTPRLYRGERLPCALPWNTVRAFLASIDRSTPVGKRDYAMFLLIATYGLRISEVAALRLNDIEWRAGQLRVPRPKVKTPLLLPLTEEVGAALIAYLRNGRPQLTHRQVFLRILAPKGPLGHTGVHEAFRRRTRRSGFPIHNGPHCLRHSLAVELLRRGTSLKTIGDLLGHRSTESTCVYLRLNIEDLRDVALNLPAGGRS
jgi:integrase/recombinase XerD